MSPHDLLRTFAFLGVPVGIFAGLLLGLVARRVDGWGGYGSERRRAARLGHIAFVMFPVIAGAYSLWLPPAATGPALRAVAWAFCGGGFALSASLFVVAWRPSWKALLVGPSLVVFASVVGFAWFGLSKEPVGETPSRARGDRSEGEERRLGPLETGFLPVEAGPAEHLPRSERIVGRSRGLLPTGSQR